MISDSGEMEQGMQDSNPPLPSASSSSQEQMQLPPPAPSDDLSSLSELTEAGLLYEKERFKQLIMISHLLPSYSVVRVVQGRPQPADISSNTC
uniref:unconventional myosin-XVI-like n=1 Tax=Myxine glutinosa TaxID=7769 RepID=UPI00358E8870